VGTNPFNIPHPVPNPLRVIPQFYWDVLGLFENPNNAFGIQWDYKESLGDGRGCTLTTFGLTSEDQTALCWSSDVIDNWPDYCHKPSIQAQVLKHVADNYATAPIATWRGRGFVHPITLAFLLDTCIQHGDGTDPDSYWTILKKCDRYLRLGEYGWLAEVMQTRLKVLHDPANKATTKVWRESEDRVRIYQKWLGEIT
jgi:Glycosyl hydrolase family 46